MCLLGRWRLAALNLLLALLVVMAAIVNGGVFMEEFHYIWLVIASGSAGWAHAVAVNRSDPSLDKPSANESSQKSAPL